ncbi:site-specific tyrosine recombinase XerD [Kineococcus gynurae]|uniref:Tyrosine recombinase XerD n=1 Tax=Kineococcus gynurae TaxID=452979 RepID=A0ABV5LXS2_9ACTN
MLEPAPAPAREPSSGLVGALEEYLGHLGVERGLAANTLAAYRRDLQRYLRFLAGHGVQRVEDVRAAHVADFVAALRGGEDGLAPLTAASTARTASALRGWHRFLQAEGRCADDPAAAVRPPAPPRRLPHALTVEEVTALLAAAEQVPGPTGLRDRALLELLYGCGARISEVVGLDVDDVALLLSGPSAEDGLIRLRGKGSKERVVPMGSFARAAVQAYLVRARPALAVRGGPALFLNARGSRLSRQSAWAVLQAAAGRAGIERAVGPHTLRHSFATHLLRGGADVRVVQELLGHASVATTQVYTQVTVDTLREVHAETHPRGGSRGTRGPARHPGPRPAAG